MRIALLILCCSMAVAIGAAQFGDQPEQLQAAEDSHSRSMLRSAVSPSSDSSADSVVTAPSSTVETLPVRSGQSAEVDDSVVAPSRVRVPSLGLDVDIVAVGVDADGLFDVPSADQVGWYRYGPTPGAPGSAVLAAHVDYNGELGAFYALRDLLPGDLVEVDYDDGSSQSFQIVDQTLYDKTALPADELFRRSGESVLHLATCGGTFDPVSRSYLGNRVVVAVPVVADVGITPHQAGPGPAQP